MATAPPASARSELRDFYAVLGAEPSATVSELRVAFREAVMRHHPDRSPADAMATRRTALLNRAWSELRDPLRRLHYDRALERGSAEAVAWPLARDELEGTARPRTRRTVSAPGRWHDPTSHTVRGFRVPTEVFRAGPAAQAAYIGRTYIDGEDWRSHRERYWLREAASIYRERGRTDDWLGAVERLVELDDSHQTLVDADLRTAYLDAGEYLRGVGFLRAIEARTPVGSAEHRWLARELRALLGAFRDARVRRGPPDDRAEAAELLLNYLEALGMTPAAADVRAAIAAHRRARNLGRATELVERALAVPIQTPAGWYAAIQFLTEAGQLERASALLAQVARGDHPEALDRRRLRSDPGRRLATARRRLERARARARSRVGGA